MDYNEKWTTGNIHAVPIVNLRSDRRIGMWNVRKLKQAGKLGTICRELDRRKIHILDISETNWNDSGSFTTAENKLTYLGNTSGYYKGVAVILIKEITGFLIGYTPVSDRITKLRLQRKPHSLITVQCYAPKSAASEKEIDGFCDGLRETLNYIPNRDIKIVMGDTNDEMYSKSHYIASKHMECID